MERLVLAAALIAVAGVAALLLQRRRPTAPVRTSWTVPAQLNRADFPWPDAEWLLVVFTSASCDTCRSTWALAQDLSHEDLAVVEIEVTRDRALHERYGIDAVPLVLIADHEGGVRASFVGPPSPAELTDAVADLVPRS